MTRWVILVLVIACMPAYAASPGITSRLRTRPGDTNIYDERGKVVGAGFTPALRMGGQDSHLPLPNG